MNIGEYIKRQNKRVDKLLEYTEHIEEVYFDKGELSELTERQVYERYNLAKETLLKEMNNIQSIAKINKDVKPINEEDPLISIISSLTDGEKEQLKAVILEIKRKQSNGEQSKLT